VQCPLISGGSIVLYRLIPPTKSQLCFVLLMFSKTRYNFVENIFVKWSNICYSDKDLQIIQVDISFLCLKTIVFRAKSHMK